MPLTPSANRRRWRKKWDFFLNSLFVILAILLSPFLLICIIAEGNKYEKEKRRIANRTHCDICGTLLGEGAIEKSDAALREEANHAMGPGYRGHTVRICHAICVECGARYRYYEDSKYIKYFKRIPDSTELSLL